MDFFELAILAIVQGVTEFLPISSQAHNIFVLKWMGVEEGSQREMVLNLAVHFGSLFAVVAYFWRDLSLAVLGPAYLIADIRRGGGLTWPSKLCLLLIFATIPAVLFFLALDAVDAVSDLRTVEIIGWTTLIFGVLLYAADRVGASERDLRDWTWGDAIVMGLAQAAAIIPGVSRSGVVMTMGRFLGFDRRETARISLLMAAPIILAASGKGALDVIEAGDVTLGADAAVAAILSGLSAYIAIVLMMRWLSRATFTPFVVYRIVLGAALLVAAYA